VSGVDDWARDIKFETPSSLARLVKQVLVNPFANYAPAGLIRWILKATGSELAAANWADPGGWRSMVISYDGQCHQWSDKVLVGSGTIPMALRNRRLLAGRVLARVIDECPSEPVEVLCIGAGPGRIIIDAMLQAEKRARATLVDLNSDAHHHAHRLARSCGLGASIRFITADARHLDRYLDGRVDVVKMIGICEYLQDEQIVSIAKAAGVLMPAGAPFLLNSLSKRHGTDRFFRRVFGLHMIHRSVDELCRLMTAAGFGDFASLSEPLGVYDIILARKQG